MGIMLLNIIGFTSHSNENARMLASEYIDCFSVCDLVFIICV